MTNPALIGATLGTATGIASSAAISKLTGKPVGVSGSIAHIATNPNLDSKGKIKTIAQITGQQLKDTVTIAGVTTVAGGSAALAAKHSNKFVNYLKGVKDGTLNYLNKFSVNGKSVSKMLTDSKIYQKISKLPTWGKAAALVGAGTAAVLGAIGLAKAQADAGYIEAKNETKIVKV